jgi:hypothetical protein
MISRTAGIHGVRRYIMEGFFEMQVPAWVVRVVTRAVAIVPAFIVVYTYGADSAADLIEQAQVLRCPPPRVSRPGNSGGRRAERRCGAQGEANLGVMARDSHSRRFILRSLHRSLWRQVVVNFVVPFTVIPLTKFLSSELKMGPFKLSKPLEMLCWLCSAVAIVLNMMSLYDFFSGLEALPSPVRSPCKSFAPCCRRILSHDPHFPLISLRRAHLQ